MKIKLELDVSDLFDYDEYTETYYFKNNEEVKNDIIEQVKNEIINMLDYRYIDNFQSEELIKEFVKENKDQIIKQIVDKVSDKIIKNKAIQDFKKSLNK